MNKNLWSQSGRNVRIRKSKGKWEPAYFVLPHVFEAKLSIAWLHVKGQGTTPAGSHWVTHVILCAYIILIMFDYAVTFLGNKFGFYWPFYFNGLKSRVKALPPWNIRQKVKRLVLLCVALKLPYANVGLFYLVQIWYPLKSYLLNFFFYWVVSKSSD